MATGLNGLQGTVENLDNYKPVANTTVQFGSGKATLTKADQQMLDEFAQQINQQKHYIVQVQGFTDAVGSAEYNNQLSRRRADAVIQYLAAKHNVPPYRVYIIGLGKDNPGGGKQERCRPCEEPPCRCATADQLAGVGVSATVESRSQANSTQRPDSADQAVGR